jgi:UDP-glucose:(heptosyl)LPS alpha-1,3-glucosyltransferase
MRIGLVCQSCNNRTGIGRIVNSLASEFIGVGHHVMCAAQDFEGIDTRITQRRVPSISPSKGLNKLLFRLNGRPFRESEVDVIHTFGVGRNAHIVSAQSCHRAGMELLRAHQAQILERQVWGVYDHVSLSDERALLTLPFTRQIIAVSQMVKLQIVRTYGIDGERIAVVPNGVRLESFEMRRTNLNRPELRAALGLSHDDYALLFVGNEYGRKGLKVFIQSLSILRDRSLRILVVGGGDREQYQGLAAELGVEDQVKFLGSITSPEDMYFAADLLVHPSLYEPFGIVVIEAMAAGLPVIASATCGATEGMQHRKHVLLLEDPTSLAELSGAIQLLREDHVLRQTLIAGGMEKSKEYSWGRIAETILALYQGVRRSL